MNSTSLRNVLHSLAASGRTGALHVGGSPGGVLYLVDGHLVHAESPASPGIGERLVTSGRVQASVWRSAYAEGRTGHRVGRVLVRDGHLGQHELACRVLAAIGDATRALLQSGDAPMRFAGGERHWLGEVTTVDLGDVIRHTAKRLRTVPVPRMARNRPGWPRRSVLVAAQRNQQAVAPAS